MLIIAYHANNTKSSTQKPMGLLMPLNIPKAVWEGISVDFITRLLLVQGKSVIIVVVDRMSKFCHFGALSSKYTTTSVAEYFVSNIIKLHGYPLAVTLDRESIYQQNLLHLPSNSM